MDGSASPRNPRDDMPERSSMEESLEVAKRSTDRTASSADMPHPSSETRMSASPASSNSTIILVAPASSEFSTSSLTTDAGRSTTSPAAIRLKPQGQAVGCDPSYLPFPWPSSGLLDFCKASSGVIRSTSRFFISSHRWLAPVPVKAVLLRSAAPNKDACPGVSGKMQGRRGPGGDLTEDPVLTWNRVSLPPPDRIVFPWLSTTSEEDLPWPIRQFRNRSATPFVTFLTKTISSSLHRNTVVVHTMPEVRKEREFAVMGRNQTFGTGSAKLA